MRWLFTADIWVVNIHYLGLYASLDLMALYKFYYLWFLLKWFSSTILCSMPCQSLMRMLVQKYLSCLSTSSKHNISLFLETQRTQQNTDLQYQAWCSTMLIIIYLGLHSTEHSHHLYKHYTFNVKKSGQKVYTPWTTSNS